MISEERRLLNQNIRTNQPVFGCGQKLPWVMEVQHAIHNPQSAIPNPQSITFAWSTRCRYI